VGFEIQLVMQQEQLRILLVEDDEAFARTLSGMLEQAQETAGTITVAPSLDSALAQLSRLSFDVVILEFFLQDGAGLPNIAVLKAAAPHVPVIVVGAEDDEAIAVEAVHAGAQDYLVKGQVDGKLLDRSLRYAIERKRAESAIARLASITSALCDECGRKVAAPSASFDRRS